MRRLQFSLRTMLLAVLVTVAVLGWLVWGICRERERTAAIDELQSNGVSVTSEWRGPIWLYKPLSAIGWLPFRHVVRLESYNPSYADACMQLERLTLFPEIEILAFRQPRSEGKWLSDDDLCELRVLQNLRCLHLEGKQITDEGLRHLRGATRLQRLCLDRTSIRGEGLAHLTCDKELTELRLRNTLLDDRGMAESRASLAWNSCDCPVRT